MAPRHCVIGAVRFEIVFCSHFQGPKLSKTFPFFVAFLYHHSFSNPMRVKQHFLKLVIFYGNYPIVFITT